MQGVGEGGRPPLGDLGAADAGHDARRHAVAVDPGSGQRGHSHHVDPFHERRECERHVELTGLPRRDANVTPLLRLEAFPREGDRPGAGREPRARSRARARRARSAMSTTRRTAARSSTTVRLLLSKPRLRCSPAVSQPPQSAACSPPSNTDSEESPRRPVGLFAPESVRIDGPPRVRIIQVAAIPTVASMVDRRTSTLSICWLSRAPNGFWRWNGAPFPPSLVRIPRRCADPERRLEPAADVLGSQVDGRPPSRYSRGVTCSTPSKRHWPSAPSSRVSSAASAVRSTRSAGRREVIWTQLS